MKKVNESQSRKSLPIDALAIRDARKALNARRHHMPSSQLSTFRCTCDCEVSSKNDHSINISNDNCIGDMASNSHICEISEGMTMGVDLSVCDEFNTYQRLHQSIADTHSLCVKEMPNTIRPEPFICEQQKNLGISRESNTMNDDHRSLKASLDQYDHRLKTIDRSTERLDASKSDLLSQVGLESGQSHMQTDVRNPNDDRRYHSKDQRASSWWDKFNSWFHVNGNFNIKKLEWEHEKDVKVANAAVNFSYSTTSISNPPKLSVVNSDTSSTGGNGNLTPGFTARQGNLCNNSDYSRMLAATPVNLSGQVGLESGQSHMHTDVRNPNDDRRYHSKDQRAPSWWDKFNSWFHVNGNFNIKNLEWEHKKDVKEANQSCNFSNSARSNHNHPYSDIASSDSHSTKSVESQSASQWSQINKEPTENRKPLQMQRDYTIARNRCMSTDFAPNISENNGIDQSNFAGKQAQLREISYHSRMVDTKPLGIKSVHRNMTNVAANITLTNLDSQSTKSVESQYSSQWSQFYKELTGNRRSYQIPGEYHVQRNSRDGDKFVTDRTRMNGTHNSMDRINENCPKNPAVQQIQMPSPLVSRSSRCSGERYDQPNQRPCESEYTEHTDNKQQLAESSSFVSQKCCLFNLKHSKQAPVNDMERSLHEFMRGLEREFAQKLGPYTSIQDVIQLEQLPPNSSERELFEMILKAEMEIGRRSA